MRKQPMAENREKCPKLPHWVFSCFSHKNRFGCDFKRLHVNHLNKKRWYYLVWCIEVS